MVLPMPLSYLLGILFFKLLLLEQTLMDVNAVGSYQEEDLLVAIASPIR